MNPRPLRCERSALPTELAPHLSETRHANQKPRRVCRIGLCRLATALEERGGTWARLSRGLHYTQPATETLPVHAILRYHDGLVDVFAASHDGFGGPVRLLWPRSTSTSRCSTIAPGHTTISSVSVRKRLKLCPSGLRGVRKSLRSPGVYKSGPLIRRVDTWDVLRATYQ